MFPDRTQSERDWHERQTRDVKRDFPHSRKVDMPGYVNVPLDFEQLATDLWDKEKWVTWLNFSHGLWKCTLMDCGTWPPAEGTGDTALSALQAAIVRKNEITRSK